MSGLRIVLQVLFFRNPESLASIPSVWHGHVVSRQEGAVT